MIPGRRSGYVKGDRPKMTKNRVLVLIDGSDFARQIFPHLSRYLPPEYNDLILLRVEGEPHGHIGTPARPASSDSKVMVYERRADLVEAQYPIYASQEWESSTAAAAQSMREDVHLLELAGYTVTTEVRFDSHPAEAIARYVQNHDINMIAMTTHGRTGLTRLVFGSVAQYLMTHLDVPIMIVRPNDKFDEVEEE